MPCTPAPRRVRVSLSIALASIVALPACTGTRATQRADTAPAAATAGGHASIPVAPSPVVVPLDRTSLAALPRERVQARAHGRALDCEGIPLAALLRQAHAMPAGKLPGALLASYVLVQARDGYRALFALAELDPATGGRSAYVVERCDGAALGPEDGPLRLIVPDDARPARWVRQLKSITVVAAP